MRRPASEAGRSTQPRLPHEPRGRPSKTPDARDAQECEACGTRMYGLHCKIVCPNCGYKRDCSDP